MKEAVERETWIESAKPGHLELIGKVITRFSELEGWVAELVRHYSGMNEAAGYAVTGRLRMRAMLEVLPDLVRATTTNHRLHADIDSIRKELLEISEERDKIAHWQWIGGAEGWGIAKWLTARKPSERPPITSYPRAKLSTLVGQMTKTLLRIQAHLLPDEEWTKMPKNHRDKFWPSPWRDEL